MKPLTHSSALPSHYSKQAYSYDVFNQDNWVKQLNQTIENLLKKYKVKTILDMTCGTGSQVFWLNKCHHEVIGSDFNSNMLKIAKNKAKKEKLAIKFIKGDVRTLKVGKFDTVITMANAIGHLTKNDFEKALRNIHANLKDGGLYLFDINNLAYLIKENNITKLTIDWHKNSGSTTFRDIQYSTIDKDGILASYTTSYIQKDSQKPKVTHNAQTLQIYSAKQLKEILLKNGFKILRQLGIDGSTFSNTKTETILTVAQKIRGV